MPAHLRPKPPCNADGCRGAATYDLYNTWNAWQGAYCDQHKDAALRFVQEGEQRRRELDVDNTP